MHNRIFVCLIILAMLLLAASAVAEEITDASGQWKYVLKDGGAVITGYEEEPSGDLVIPGELDGYPVTIIGECAFQDCRYLTGVTIPESVTRIDGEAFAICLSLTSVTIPDGVTSIGEWAFKDCLDLTDVTIGKNVTSIGGLAFFACESLTNVIIPESVTDIGELAFGDCKELTLTVTQGSYAEQYAKDCNIPYDVTGKSSSLQSLPSTPKQQYSEKVTLENDRTVNIRSGSGTQHPQIGEAYTGMSFFFTGVVENGFLQILYPCVSNDLGYVTAYVMQSFASVSPVSSQDMIFSSPAGDVKIKQNAEIYLDAALRVNSKYKISDYSSMPYAGVSSSGSYAVLFNRTNDKGEEVLWIGFVSPNDVGNESGNDEPAPERPTANGRWKYILEGGGATITGYESELNDHGFPLEPSGDLVIPGKLDGHSVTGIGDGAFYECIGLTSVVIPDSVTSIGSHAFHSCSRLVSVVIPDNVTSIGEGAFYYCSNLANVTIPGGVTSIGAYTFHSCRNLTGVIIPEGVTSIKDGAFYHSGLSSVTIPASVTDIGRNPFESCPLESIGVSPGNPAYEQIDGVLFDKRQKKLVSYPSAREGEYAIPEGTLCIGEFAFCYCYGLTGISIPNTVTSIGECAFGSCRNITSVAISDSVTDIGKYAFSNHEKFSLMVKAGSYAEQYAKDYGIAYVYGE